jgi:hypothetical protein
VFATAGVIRLHFALGDVVFPAFTRNYGDKIGERIPPEIIEWDGIRILSFRFAMYSTPAFAIIFKRQTNRFSFAKCSFVISCTRRSNTQVDDNRSTCLRIQKRWLREKESNLHLRVQSPTCCRLHHRAQSLPIFDCRLASDARGQLEICNWQSAMTMVAVEGVEPSSLDYRSNALPLSYTANKNDLWTLCFGL